MQFPQNSPRLDTLFGQKLTELPISPESEAYEEATKAYLEEFLEAELAEKLWVVRNELFQAVKTHLAADPSKRPRQEKVREVLQKEELQDTVALYRVLLDKAQQPLEEGLQKHSKEQLRRNGRYVQYQQEQEVLAKAERTLADLLSKHFYSSRGKTVPEAQVIQRGILKQNIQKQKDKLQELQSEHPDVAATMAWEQILDYATQLESDGFIWTDSRRELLAKTMERALSNKPMMVFWGESGTGKTDLGKGIGREMTEEEVRRETGGRDMELRRILGSTNFKVGQEEGRESSQSYFAYGNLLQAMSGKESSLDTAPKHQGAVYFDDEFNSRPAHVQKQLLKFVSGARPGRKIHVPGTGEEIIVQPNFLYLAAGNPASDKYATSQETPVEAYRELAGNVINVGYLEQSKEQPELFQVLLAGAIDMRVRRFTVWAKEELAPPRKQVTRTHIDASGVKSEQQIWTLVENNPKAGGILWRFANCWKELFRAFSHEETVLSKANHGQPPESFYLDSFVLDPGVLLGWLDSYKKDPTAQGSGFEGYLTGRLREYLEDNRVMYGKDVPIVRQYLAHFGIDLNKHEKPAERPPVTNLTPQEAGYLMPYLEEPVEGISITTLPSNHIATLEGGEEVWYRERLANGLPTKGYTVGGHLLHTAEQTRWRILGTEYVKDGKGTSMRPTQRIILERVGSSPASQQAVHVTELFSAYKEAPRAEGLEKLLAVRASYEAQVADYRSFGWLKVQNGKEGIVGVDGQHYPLPTLEQVYEQLEKKQDILKAKHPQGFSRFVLVPFGMSYLDMIGELTEQYRTHQVHPAGLFRSDGTTKFTAEINAHHINDELKGAHEQEVRYRPTQQQPNGRSKQEVIQDSEFPGWQIEVFPENVLIPRAGQGKAIGNRPQLETQQSINQYNATLGTAPYDHEHLLTPESAAALAFTILREKRQVIWDYYENDNDSALLCGGVLTRNVNVPLFYFYSNYGKLYLSYRTLDDADSGVGALSSVGVC